MAHWKTMANYDYLGAYSLDGIAKEVTLTIASVKKELVKGEGGMTDECIVASFEEKNVGGVIVKPMILNKTNCKIIEKVYGTGDVEQWIGKSIIIYSTTTRFQRDIVPCLRVKEEKPVFTCSVCGKEIEKKTYDASKAKYGTPLCSKECLEKNINMEGKE